MHHCILCLSDLQNSHRTPDRYTAYAFQGIYHSDVLAKEVSAGTHFSINSRVHTWAPFGAFTTRKLPERKMHIIFGILVSVLVVWTLIKIIIA